MVDSGSLLTELVAVLSSVKCGLFGVTGQWDAFLSSCLFFWVEEDLRALNHFSHSCALNKERYLWWQPGVSRAPGSASRALLALDWGRNKHMPLSFHQPLLCICLMRNWFKEQLQQLLPLKSCTEYLASLSPYLPHSGSPVCLQALCVCSSLLRPSAPLQQWLLGSGISSCSPAVWHTF